MRLGKTLTYFGHISLMNLQRYWAILLNLPMIQRWG